MPATFRMTSLGEVQPESFPVNLTPMTRGHLSSQGMSASTMGRTRVKRSMKYWKEDGILHMEHSSKLQWLKKATQDEWNKVEAKRMAKINKGRKKESAAV